MTWQDPIVAEVRAIREAYAARFNYDLQAIYRDLKAQERQSGWQTVSLPAAEPVVATATPIAAAPETDKKISASSSMRREIVFLASKPAVSAQIKEAKQEKPKRIALAAPGLLTDAPATSSEGKRRTSITLSSQIGRASCRERV